MPRWPTALRDRNPRTGRGDGARVLLLGAARGPLAWAGTWRGGVVLAVLSLLVLIPGLWTLPPIDRDEARFAQASRQMLLSGDVVVPMVQDRPRLNKPPLIYWLQSASAGAFTAASRAAGSPQAQDAIWMYRVPGMLCTLLAVLLTWRLGLRLLDARAAWLGAAFLAVAPVVVFDAHQARSDQLLLLTVVAVQWALWRVLSREGDVSGGRVLAFWALLGVSVLAKGPIGPMIALLTVLAWCGAKREWRGVLALKPWWGVLVATGIVAPWVIAVGQQVGWERYLSIIHAETLGRSVEPKEGHWGPPGYHLVLLVALMFPGSLLTGAAVVQALRRGMTRRVRWSGRGADLFLLAWALPAWLVFELVSTKLPHYVMPLYPALALLSARATLRASEGMLQGIRGLGVRAGAAAWCLVGVALTGGAPIFASAWGFAHGMSGIAATTGIAAGVVGALLCAGAGVWALRERVMRAVLWSGAATVLALVTLLGVVLPSSQHLWLSKRIADAALRADPAGARPLAAAGYHEDSLIFLTGGRIARLPDDRVDAWLDAHRDGLLILPRGMLGERTGLREVTSERGFNYSRGRWTDLVLAERVFP